MRQLILACVLALVSTPAFAAIDYAALKAELTTNPTNIAGLSAAVSAGQDCQASFLLNVVTATNIFQAVASDTLKGALDPTEFATLSSTQLQQLGVMFSGDSVDAANANIRTIVNNIFSPAASFQNTRANLLALVRRLGSRAEVLFGAGVVLSCADVQKARLLL